MPPFQPILMAVAAASATQPVQLSVTPSAAGLEISVVGNALHPVMARYRLEVTGGTGNRSVQSGDAQLEAGKPVTLSTVRISTPGGSPWSVRLHVEPRNAPPYDVERSAS